MTIKHNSVVLMSTGGRWWQNNEKEMLTYVITLMLTYIITLMNKEL